MPQDRPAVSTKRPERFEKMSVGAVYAGCTVDTLRRKVKAGLLTRYAGVGVQMVDLDEIDQMLRPDALPDAS